MTSFTRAAHSGIAYLVRAWDVVRDRARCCWALWRCNRPTSRGRRSFCATFSGCSPWRCRCGTAARSPARGRRVPAAGVGAGVGVGVAAGVAADIAAGRWRLACSPWKCAVGPAAVARRRRPATPNSAPSRNGCGVRAPRPKATVAAYRTAGPRRCPGPTGPTTSTTTATATTACYSRRRRSSWERHRGTEWSKRYWRIILVRFERHIRPLVTAVNENWIKVYILSQ